MQPTRPPTVMPDKKIARPSLCFPVDFSAGHSKHNETPLLLLASVARRSLAPVSCRWLAPVSCLLIVCPPCRPPSSCPSPAAYTGEQRWQESRCRWRPGLPVTTSRATMGLSRDAAAQIRHGGGGLAPRRPSSSLHQQIRASAVGGAPPLTLARRSGSGGGGSTSWRPPSFLLRIRVAEACDSSFQLWCSRCSACFTFSFLHVSVVVCVLFQLVFRCCCSSFHAWCNWCSLYVSASVPTCFISYSRVVAVVVFMLLVQQVFVVCFTCFSSCFARCCSRCSGVFAVGVCGLFHLQFLDVSVVVLACCSRCSGASSAAPPMFF
jgi:hypothetical protein